MEGVAEEFEAKAEAIVFLDHFRELPDPRQRGKVLYPLDEILLLCLLAVLAGAETFVDFALFSQMKREFLRRFRPFGDHAFSRSSGRYFCFARRRAIPA